MTATDPALQSAPQRFRVPASEVFLYLLMMPRKSWAVWSLAGIGLVLIIAGVIADMRLMAIGLMVWLALVPTAAFFMHYTEALSPSVSPNLLPHTVERIPGGYIVRVYRQLPDEETGETALLECNIISISDSDVTNVSVSGMYRRLMLSGTSLSILFLPLTPNL